jgi:hypothetical protein
MTLVRALVVATVLALTAWIGLSVLPASTTPPVVDGQETILFAESFDTFNDCNYGFGYHRPFDDGNTPPDTGPGNEWDCEHLADGGDRGAGDGAAHVVMHAGVEQYNLGWDKVTGGSWSMGDAVYLAWKMRWDDTARLPSGGVEPDLGGKNKFIIFGSGPRSSTPQSRMIMYVETPTDGGGGCMLGSKDYAKGPDPGDAGNSGFNRWATPGHFGLRGGDNDFYRGGGLKGTYWSLEPQIGIDGEDSCGKPVLMTYGSNTKAPPPGPNSAAPVNGWYKIIVKIQSGEAGKAGFTVWANNCTESKPTSTTLTAPIGVGGWGSYSNNFGAYLDQEPGIDLGYRIDDLQVSRGAFPQAWCDSGK